MDVDRPQALAAGWCRGPHRAAHRSHRRDAEGAPGRHRDRLRLYRRGQGRVLDPADDNPNTVAIRDLNESLPHDDRVEAVLLAIRDGVMLVRKR